MNRFVIMAHDVNISKYSSHLSNDLYSNYQALNDEYKKPIHMELKHPSQNPKNKQERKKK
jgi:hypothetical protein